jgi:hypothetical protein
MPIKSKAQRRKFAELLVAGEISPETFEEWNRGAGDAQLPERLHPKGTTKTKQKSSTKTTVGRTTAVKRARKATVPKKAATRQRGTTKHKRTPARKPTMKRSTGSRRKA